MSTRTKVTPLEDRHVQVNVSPRLAFISKAMVRKPVNQLVAVYAGFDCLEMAERFSEYATLNWGKTSFDVLIRPGKRTLSKWEVKVRKPTDAQLQALVKKAQQVKTGVSNVGGHPPDDAPLAARRMPTASKVGNRVFSID